MMIHHRPQFIIEEGPLSSDTIFSTDIYTIGGLQLMIHSVFRSTAESEEDDVDDEDGEFLRCQRNKSNYRESICITERIGHWALFSLSQQ
jgi:hypothetical protein